MKNLKTVNMIVLSIVMIMTSFSTFAMNSAENEEVCKQYAVEDQVVQEDLADYIATCLENMATEQGEAESSDKPNDAD